MLVSLSGRVCNLRVGKPFITEKKKTIHLALLCLCETLNELAKHTKTLMTTHTCAAHMMSQLWFRDN